MTDAAYDRLYVQFLKLFNEERDYYTCHDVMEELWLEEGRKPLLQGLLQVAVGLHHHQNGNRPGAIKLLEAALNKLNGYADEIMGIQLHKLRQDTELVLAALKCAAHLPPFRDITIEVLDPALQQQIDQVALPAEEDD
ncbi:DUF309 domain-containing protein [Paenibacillus sp. 481]|uniref:DUF309 domain-containing protein n=1 Tax=Paenibacillus sp. 481 TaxID=2835869 RepID=UPI001E2F23EB|nr:DUF309 domain-containing protein [Paenibacillus sp. 481]UHA72622.1 DUF309 domain-containing protein [Paenibacillus sp. 481]